MKHLVMIIDGTWVSAADSDGERFSNAYNLNWLLDSQDNEKNPQVSYYYSGVGSDKKAAPYLSGATARGIDHLTRDAYINLCSNFRFYANGEKDKIYLFGFSRGSVVARALSGLIDACGILKPNRMYLFPYIWDCYINGATLDGKLTKATYRNIPVEFMGLFDCVFGIRDKSGRFYTLKFNSYDLASCVKTAVHIISIDDERPAFSPMFFTGLRKDASVMEQIWLPGVHSDIGGTYSNDHIGNISLLTMCDRIKKYTGLQFHGPSIEHYKRSRQNLARINDDHQDVWKLFSRLRSRRKYDQSIPHQYIHPVYKMLVEGPELHYKNARRPYPGHAQFNDAEVFDDFVENYDWADMLGI